MHYNINMFNQFSYNHLKNICIFFIKNQPFIKTIKNNIYFNELIKYIQKFPEFKCLCSYLVWLQNYFNKNNFEYHY